MALREVLATELGTAPAAVRFLRSEHGRPVLAEEASLRFSLSHSNDLALIAVGHVGAIGVDVEQTRPIPALADLLDDVFTTREREEIAQLDSQSAHWAFLRGWTRKEAVAKAMGRGIETLGRVEVSLGESDARVVRLDIEDEDASQWTLADLHLGPSHVGALAVRESRIRYELRDWAIS